MTSLLVRRALADYARRPLNLVLLVAVPVVIVVALSGELATFSKLLSTTAKPLHLDVATAGWAAAAVAGLTGFFQVVGSRATDRRLAAVSAQGATPVVAGRLFAAGGLAVAASAAALAALAIKAGIADPARAIPAVLLVAVMYGAIGVLTGTLVRSEMNGALVVSVIWMLDVFVGSGLEGNASLITRVFPLHFPTMVLTNQAAHHGGPISAVGWTLLWTAGLVTLAVARLATTIRSARPFHFSPADTTVATTPSPKPAAVTIELTKPGPTGPQPVAEIHAEVTSPIVARPRTLPASRLVAGMRAAVRDFRRNRVLWVLLLAVPVLFIALAAGETPTTLMPVTLDDSARQFTAMFSLRQIHAGEMAAVASALLAGVAGLFVVTGSADGDRRLLLAGFKPRQVLAGHLGVIAGAAVVTAAVSLGVSAGFFSPRLWIEYAGADLLIALTYAMVGVLFGPLVGRLGGLYVLLLLSIVDVGFGQTVMFHPVPPAWGAFLPSRGAARLMLAGAFTSGFEQFGYLLLGLGWLAALTVAAVFVFRTQIGTKRPRALPPGRSSTPLDQPAPLASRTPGAASQKRQKVFVPSSHDGATFASEADVTARDLERGSGPDHSAQQGHQRGYGSHGGHHWMMLACCIPMIITVLALVAAGTISIGFVLFAVLCVGMMALMMGAMDHGSPHR